MNIRYLMLNIMYSVNILMLLGVFQEGEQKIWDCGRPESTGLAKEWCAIPQKVEMVNFWSWLCCQWQVLWNPGGCSPRVILVFIWWVDICHKMCLFVVGQYLALSVKFWFLTKFYCKSRLCTVWALNWNQFCWPVCSIKTRYGDSETVYVAAHHMFMLHTWLAIGAIYICS